MSGTPLRKTIRIFIASPGDVAVERNLALGVIERLREEFRESFELMPIVWESLTLDGNCPVQETIARRIEPWQTHIVIGVLWSRLGLFLTEDFGEKGDGSCFRGTEWELENALEGVPSFRREQPFGPGEEPPKILVFRRDAPPDPTRPSDPEYAEIRAQQNALDEFWSRRFVDADGKSLGGFELYDTPASFEKNLASRLQSYLKQIEPLRLAEDEKLEAGSWSLDRGSPYRGLEVFDLQHAAIFCGRNQAIKEVKERIIRRAQSGCAFLLVLGMSGSGKSSLIRAGVLPRLCSHGDVGEVGHWRWAVLRPSDCESTKPGEDPPTPAPTARVGAQDAPTEGQRAPRALGKAVKNSGLCGALAEALVADDALPRLAQDFESVEGLADRLRSKPTDVAAAIAVELNLLRQRARLQGAPAESGDEARLVLLVDQFEEIFTLEPGDATRPAFIKERADFVRALDVLARSGCAWIIATMRSDFYHRCSELELLMALKEGDGQYDLRPPTRSQIAEMILEPARAAGLEFETDRKTGAQLDNVLLDEAEAGMPGSLPLLSFTLAELYKKSNKGQLTFAAYNTLGGLTGAIGVRAQAVLAKLPSDARRTLPALIRALATVRKGETDDGEVEVIAARRVPMAVLASSADKRTLLTQFIAARLIVTDRTNKGPIARVAHEALLSQWHEARRILDQAARRRRRWQIARWAAASAALFLAAYVAFFVPGRKPALTTPPNAPPVIPTKTKYFAHRTKKNGVPWGIGELGNEEWSQRAVTLRFTTKGDQVQTVEAIDGYGLPTHYNEEEAYLFGGDQDKSVSRFTYKWDGTSVTETALDAKGWPVWTFGFLAADSGRYTDEEGKGMPIPRGHSDAEFVTFTYDKNGFEQEIHYLDKGKNATRNAERVYGYRQVFDEGGVGLVLEKSCLNESGSPMECKDGYAKLTARFNERGDETERVFWGLDNKPVRTKNGYARVTSQYDKDGNRIEVAFFAEDLQTPAPESKYHLARWTAAFDHGNQTGAEYFDETGKNLKVVPAVGYARWKADFNQDGQEVERRHFGKDREPINIPYGYHPYGYHKQVRIFDRGLQTDTKYFDKDGHTLAVSIPDGFAWWHRTYDAQGRKIREYFLNEKGAPVTSADGYAKATITYDGKTELWQYFNADGTPGREKGSAVRRVTRDRRRLTRQEQEDCLNGESHKRDVASQEQEDFLNREPNPGPNPDPYGIVRITRGYDRCGNQLEETRWALGRQKQPEKLVHATVKGNSLLVDFCCDKGNRLTCLAEACCLVRHKYTDNVSPGDLKKVLDNVLAKPLPSNWAATCPPTEVAEQYIVAGQPRLNPDTHFSKCVTKYLAGIAIEARYYDAADHEIRPRVVVQAVSRALALRDPEEVVGRSDPARFTDSRDVRPVALTAKLEPNDELRFYDRKPITDRFFFYGHFFNNEDWITSDDVKKHKPRELEIRKAKTGLLTTLDVAPSQLERFNLVDSFAASDAPPARSDPQPPSRPATTK